MLQTYHPTNRNAAPPDRPHTPAMINVNGARCPFRGHLQQRPTQQVPGKAGSACRVIDPTREAEPRFGHGVRVERSPTGSEGQRLERGVDCGGQSHRGVLNEGWIHGDDPCPRQQAEARGASHLARLEAAASAARGCIRPVVASRPSSPSASVHQGSSGQVSDLARRAPSGL